MEEAAGIVHQRKESSSAYTCRCWGSPQGGTKAGMGQEASGHNQQGTAAA